MREWEKAQAGYLYDASYDQDIVDARIRCKELCFDFNHCRPSELDKQAELIRKLIGSIQGRFTITAPFWCDYGLNISIGDHFYANHNCTILDGAKVTFGDHVFIGPNCVFSTAGHPIDGEMRVTGLEIALPITVGDAVWIGANTTVLPGVSIGGNTIIGAGSVVNKDVPSNVIAAGNPCKVIRAITEADKRKYPVFTDQPHSISGAP